MLTCNRCLSQWSKNRIRNCTQSIERLWQGTAGTAVLTGMPSVVRSRKLTETSSQFAPEQKPKVLPSLTQAKNDRLPTILAEGNLTPEYRLAKRIFDVAG